MKALALHACVLWVLVLGTLPIQADEISELKEELQRLRDEYQRKLNELDQRLSDLEDPKDAGELKVLQAHEAKEALPPAKPGFAFEGYFRSGFGVSNSGQSAQAFKAPGADAKYRLGNEVDTYMETTFRQEIPALPDQRFYIQTRLAYSIPENGAAVDSTFSVREVFAEAQGVIDDQPDMAFWAGQRFYDRYDVHINDYYYLDMSGFGGGITGIDMGVGELWLALLGGTIDQLNSDGSVRSGDTVAKRSLDLRWKGIPAPKGEIMLWVSPSFIDGETTKEGVSVEDSGGAAFGLIHESRDEQEAWWNRFVLQYGFGPSSNFKSELIPDEVNEENPERQTRTKDSWRFRVLNHNQWQGESWGLMSLLLWEERDFGAQVDSGSRWLSAGIRPVWFLSRNASIALEAGLDHTDQDGGPRGELYKITLAPQISPGPLVDSRPVLRFFITYAAWTDEFEGQIAPDVYPEDQQGFSVGTQVEAWW